MGGRQETSPARKQAKGRNGRKGKEKEYGREGRSQPENYKVKHSCARPVTGALSRQMDDTGSQGCGGDGGAQAALGEFGLCRLGPQGHCPLPLHCSHQPMDDQ